MVVQLVVVLTQFLKGPRFHSCYWQTFAGSVLLCLYVTVGGGHSPAPPPPPPQGGVGLGGWVGG